LLERVKGHLVCEIFVIFRIILVISFHRLIIQSNSNPIKVSGLIRLHYSSNMRSSIPQCKSQKHSMILFIVERSRDASGNKNLNFLIMGIRISLLFDDCRVCGRSGKHLSSLFRRMSWLLTLRSPSE
jgi:hypothetical protein